MCGHVSHEYQLRSENDTSPGRVLMCEPGLFLPSWQPQTGVTDGQVIYRGAVYILSMSYLFVGIAYLSDKFMAAIEMITSKRREVELKDGRTAVVRVWNETVANLTLMSLGCSAPEILLSGIEIVGNGFDAGELGPGAIVGSAAFNLIFVLGVCNWAIPKGEVRRIKRLNVFLVTSAWAIFAYLWLYVILSVVTPGVIELWEALLTLICFPLTVITAFVTDRYSSWTDKTYRMGHGNVIVETPASGEQDPVIRLPLHENNNEEVQAFEEHRRDFLLHLKDLRRKHPAADAHQLELMASKELISFGTGSSFSATKKLTGLSTTRLHQLSNRQHYASNLRDNEETVTQVYFSPGHYTISETEPELRVFVTRRGGDLNRTLQVDYATEDAGGSARRGKDYVAAKGTLTFQPGQTRCEIVIGIIDDCVYEGDLHFYIRLFNLRSPEGNRLDHARLTWPQLATVMLLDDDHAGIFSLLEDQILIQRAGLSCNFKVVRKGGFRGRVAVGYQTEEGTARAGREYQHTQGVLIFEEGEVEKEISVPLLKLVHEKDVIFYLSLQDPKIITDSETDSADSGVDFSKGEFVECYIPTIDDETDRRVALEGRPRLGDIGTTVVRLVENAAFKNSVDKFMKKYKMGIERGTSAWKQQLIDAFYPEKGDDSEPSITTCKDYVIHAITVFWRIVCALIPPESFARGYPCFVISIVFIGVVTALVGDMASHFGCTVGLKDSVTALAFVSLGTSCPELFSSKVAAVQNKYADASISNVTGANAINVYLGIGLAWSMAAVYHAVQGTNLTVQSSSLGFCVTIYCCFAFMTIVILLIRRRPDIAGGELGGPLKFKLPTTVVLICMWIAFVLIASFEAYGYIKGF